MFSFSAIYVRKFQHVQNVDPVTDSNCCLCSQLYTLRNT